MCPCCGLGYLSKVARFPLGKCLRDCLNLLIKDRNAYEAAFDVLNTFGPHIMRYYCLSTRLYNIPGRLNTDALSSVNVLCIRIYLNIFRAGFNNNEAFASSKAPTDCVVYILAG